MRRPTQPSTGSSNPDALGAAESQLLQKLRDCPRAHDLDYTEQAQTSLLKDLSYSLACNKPEYLNYFFPNGVPVEGSPTAWSLSQAQGAIEGAEYSAAAKGKPCGHIFKSGEATYRCKYVYHLASCHSFANRMGPTQDLQP